jgi:acyl dehydratase
MVTIDGIAGLRELAGEELGVSPWHEITQEEIDAFAEVTGDYQWIHVDPARAASSPFGSTIAHGLLTLSLGPRFAQQIYEIVNVDFGLNYGYGRVRFPAPLPVGSRVRMRARLATVEDVPGGVQIAIEQAFERDGLEKPVCVAEILIRILSER